MYLRALYGGGVLALLGLLVVLGDVAHKGTRGYLASVSYESRTVAIGLLGALAAMMLAGLTEPLLYQRQVWVPAALLLAFYSRKSGREPSRTRTDYWTRLAPDLRHGRRSRTGGRSGKRRASGGPRESGRHSVAR
jgi:hypothetical protein